MNALASCSNISLYDLINQFKYFASISQCIQSVRHQISILCWSSPSASLKIQPTTSLPVDSNASHSQRNTPHFKGSRCILSLPPCALCPWSCCLVLVTLRCVGWCAQPGFPYNLDQASHDHVVSSLISQGSYAPLDQLLYYSKTRWILSSSSHSGFFVLHVLCRCLHIQDPVDYLGGKMCHRLGLALHMSLFSY